MDLCPLILLQIAGDTGKRIVCVSANQPHRTDHKNEDNGEHHSVFSDVLTFIAPQEIL
jgi:hypothetical protein